MTNLRLAIAPTKHYMLFSEIDSSSLTYHGHLNLSRILHALFYLLRHIARQTGRF